LPEGSAWCSPAHGTLRQPTSIRRWNLQEGPKYEADPRRVHRSATRVRSSFSGRQLRTERRRFLAPADCPAYADWGSDSARTVRS
jgi:hypothetical protein